MNSHFFLVCFGVLGCYAALRTMRRGWLRVLFVFFLIMCMAKIAIDEIFPEPIYVAQSNQAPANGESARDFFATQISALEDDRCIMEHLQDTPLGPIAYILQAHQFLRAYRQAQISAMAKGDALGSLQQAVSSTFNTDPNTMRGPSLCDRFSQWMQEQAQAQIENVVHNGQ